MQPHHCIFSVVLVGSVLGCYQPDSDTFGAPENSGGGGSKSFYAASNTSSSTGGSNYSDPDDEGFDPCPEVTYVLWKDERGNVYSVEIEVFCDPMQNINLGCPAP